MEETNSNNNSKVKTKLQSTVEKILGKHFYKILSESHLIYTLIFFLSAFFISILSLIPIPEVGNFILYFATTISLTFIFLMFVALIPPLNERLFSTEKKIDRDKIFGFLITFIASGIIVLIYFLFGSSQSIPIQFLGWDLFLPILFIIIYFGWNLAQIVFLKTGFEELSGRVEYKILPPNESIGKKETFSLIFLVLALITPVFLQIATLFGFQTYFIPQPGNLLDPYAWFIGFNLVMFIIIAITSWRLIDLFLKSKRNNTPNIFSSVFYIFIWLYLWYRGFSFINAFKSSSQFGFDVFNALIDILLMIITAILVLRSLGKKVWGARVFTNNNMPFFLYSFTMLYIIGQIIMITGAGNLPGVFSDRDQINLVNNFLILIITIAFYLWYSEYVLQRKGYIIRRHFTQEEMVNLLKDYREHLERQGYIDINQIGWSEFESFLNQHNLESKKSISKEEDFDFAKSEEIQKDTEANKDNMVEEEGEISSNHNELDTDI
ncbi:MAG: hypothetical protein GF317_24605 [Candidatus Lokiarchaeota archaeon]|nr:hypothetical protein [Candidatus Lokiarchaeota archaeon]MBD3202545.1 hypothetical protein [Candidatus Lokiarchaeota archaeon]